MVCKISDVILHKKKNTKNHVHMCNIDALPTKNILMDLLLLLPIIYLSNVLKCKIME